jgi:glutamate-1-semialdehyde 2,1-aminomutase
MRPSLFRRLFATPEYDVAYLEHNIPPRMPCKSVLGVRVRVENRGTKTWCLHDPQGRRVDLVVFCDDEVWATHHLPVAEVRPGQRVTVHFALRAPNGEGPHTLKVDLVEQGVTSFEHRGARPLTLALHAEATRPTASAELSEEAARISPWHYQPSRGIHRSADGADYPLFVSRASGCHLWSPEGRRYLDYVMGWGSALLGYNEPRVRQAIQDVMDCAPVVPFPHPLEIEVSRMLVEDVPCAEMVVFGKNGSDVCTLAARVARLFTGRTTILFCGYHGWGDWWVEHAGFGASGVPDRAAPLIHRFRFNDLADFTRLFERHRADLAAVMLEPAGPGERPGQVSGDGDPRVLQAIASMTREAGALLVYDEIMTGFRYPGGSAQKGTGVVPDLACLGKALANGMPLSALVGRAHVLQRVMEHTHYGPTYRGEVYSLAAARAALEIYRREPVAEHVWRHGEQLRDAVDGACAELGVDARMIGPPFRAGLVFAEADPRRLILKRTLYRQELLKTGLVTYDGLMLPSYAHDAAALEGAVDAVRHALGVVARAEREDDLERYLEIPPPPS